jgi:Iron-sulfur cluster-binding domain
MSSYRQEPPFAIHIELTEGCNLRCPKCGLNGIREPAPNHGLLFMSIHTADSIASQIADAGWNPRIEYAMHGEPSLHPEMDKIVKVFRKHLPKQQLMMTSNGGGLLRHPGIVANLTALFDAGLTIFAFDAYEFIKIKDKVDEALRVTEDLSFEVHRYPQESQFSPHSRYSVKKRLFIRIQDIEIAESGGHSVFNNHAGSGMEPLAKPIVARCAKPFREMSIRWNGDVAGCCNDFRGIYKTGNVVRNGLLNVWHGERMDSLRKFLMLGDRTSVKPCNVCNAKSYRVGLLPDKKGKVKMPLPTERDHAIVAFAASGPSYTPIVKREWEGK